jgi:hypothetical protein
MKDIDPPVVPTYHLFTQPTEKAVVAERSRAWRGDEFSFRDLLDIVNPLQHLPVISSIYRYFTGDSIGAIPRIIGDSLFGGPFGVVSGLVGAALKQESGKDVGETVIALVTGDDTPGATAGTAIAKADDNAPRPHGDDGTAAPVADAAAPPPTDAAPAAERTTPQQAAALPAGIPIARAAPSSTTPDVEPRAAFLNRVDALHRQASGASTLSNHVVPLQGFAVPPSLTRPRLLPTGPAPAAVLQAAVPPSTPPLDISQQMMQALEKYTRLQQGRTGTPDGPRGGQLDLAQ